MNAFFDDLDAMIWSALYVLGVLAIAEVARRRGVERATTRKIVHVLVGSWVVPTFLIFEHRLWAVVPPACFILVNALSYRYNLIRSVEGEERNVGSILYPISVSLALFAFWGAAPRPAIGAAAILVLAWGDAAASVVGRRLGRRSYSVGGHVRTLEGSAAMLVASWIAIVAAFVILGPTPAAGLLAVAAGVSLVATAVEAVSQWGFDNILVPAVTAVSLLLTHGSLWT